MSDPQTILITGASSGFGRLAAQILLERGHTVFATMRDPKGRNVKTAAGLADLAAKGKGRCHVLALDVTREKSVDQAVELALEQEGRLDAVVLNAGVGIRGLSEAVTMDQFIHLFEVNVFGAQRLCRAVLPSMRAKGSGLLLFVTSIMGRMVLPFAGPYTASKFALEALAQTYRYELAPLGIDVAILEPGGFSTGFRANMIRASDENRALAYGPLSDRQQRQWQTTTERYSSPTAPDPHIVATAMAEIIRLPAGKRPLRTVIDPTGGGTFVDQINAACDQVQEKVLTGMGMDDLLFPRTMPTVGRDSAPDDRTG